MLNIETSVSQSMATSRKNVHFFWSDSTKQIFLCPIIASTKPGNPAPEPKSDKEPFEKSINLTNCAESSMCLCQMSASVLLDIRLCFLFAIINESTKKALRLF